MIYDSFWQVVVRDLLSDPITEKTQTSVSQDQMETLKEDIEAALKAGKRISFQGYIFTPGDTFIAVYEVVNFNPPLS